MKNNKMQTAIIAGLGVLVFAVVFAGILLTRNAKKSPKTINTESAVATLEQYGSINLKTIVEAKANGEFAMGYTNPYASATGLNFLISTLQMRDAT